MKIEVGKFYGNTHNNKVECVYTNGDSHVFSFFEANSIYFDDDVTVQECYTEWHDIPEGFTAWSGGVWGSVG